MVGRGTLLLLAALVVAVVVALLALLLPEAPGARDGARATGTGPPGAAGPAMALPTTDRAAEARPLEGALEAGPAPAGIPGAGSAAPGLQDGLNGLRLSGRVVDASGAPMPGADVWFHPSFAARERLELPLRYHRAAVPWHELPHTVAGSDGRFELSVREQLAAPAALPPSLDTGFRVAPLSAEPALVASSPGLAVGAFPLHGLPAAAPAAEGLAHDAGDLTLGKGAVVVARVVDAEGLPIAGARLALARGGFDGGGSDTWALVHALTFASSDASGRLRADRCHAGTFTLSIEQQGFAPHVAEHTLREGRVTDLGEIVLARGLALTGRVLGPSGDPVIGAQLKLRPFGHTVLHGATDTVLADTVFSVVTNNRPELVASTGRDGTFAFDTLADATPLTLLASADGCEPVRVDGVLPGGEPLRLQLPPAAMLVLTIVDGATQRPVEGARVRVARRSGSPNEDMDPALTVLSGSIAAESLGRDGHAGLHVALPAGFLGHRVTASADGYGDAVVELPGLLPGERLEHVVALPVAARLSGRIVDPEGQPLDGARVNLVLAEGGAPVAGREAESGDDGSFTLDGLSAGRFHVEATRSDRVRARSPAVELVAGEQRDGVELVLRPGAHVAGRVFAPDGQPSPRTTVRLELAAPADWQVGERLNASVTTDHDGRYEAFGVPPGPVRLQAHPGALSDVVLAPGGNPDVDLWLRQQASVRGRVLDAAGAPVRAQVALEDEHWSQWETTSDASDGTFAIEDVAAGSYVLLATTEDDAVSNPVPLLLEDGTEEWVELRLGPLTLAGIVREDGSGQPVDGVTVTATNEDWASTAPEQVRDRRVRGSATSGADGRFAIARLHPGRHRLAVRGGGWIAAGPLPEVVAGSEAREVLVLVRRGASLQGRVEALPGVEFQNGFRLELAALDDATAESQGGGFDAAGPYRVTGLRPGRYRYEVKRLGRFPRPPDAEHVFAAGEVTLTAGETTALDVVLVPQDG